MRLSHTVLVTAWRASVAQADPRDLYLVPNRILCEALGTRQASVPPDHTHRHRLGGEREKEGAGMGALHRSARATDPRRDASPPPSLSLIQTAVPTAMSTVSLHKRRPFRIYFRTVHILPLDVLPGSLRNLQIRLGPVAGKQVRDPVPQLERGLRLCRGA